MDPVYLLENRAFEYFYHWIFYMLASLRQLEKPDRKVDIYMPYFKDHGFHRDSLKHFEDKFNFLFEEKDVKGREVRIHPGEEIIGVDEIAEEGYIYIRNKVLRNHAHTVVPGKYVYISRGGSEKLISNVERGQHHSILNDFELMNMLSAFPFEVVALEKLSFDEKVKLYCEAEIIVAPYGGSLVPCVFANKGTTIIELSSIGVPLTGWEHYKKICKTIGVRYFGYHNINYQDARFNIHVKLDELYKLLSALTSEHSRSH